MMAWFAAAQKSEAGQGVTFPLIQQTPAIARADRGIE
jgi:hypothetical protein